MTAKEDIRRYRENLRAELDGAAPYAALGSAEQDPVRKDLFQQRRRAAASASDLKLAVRSLGIAGLRVIACAQPCWEPTTGWYPIFVW
jgi:hypothetical protein